MGRVSAIAFRVRITVNIGVRVYSALTAMQSLHALSNYCVCVHGCMYLYNVSACAHVYLHFLFVLVCICNYISHIPLVAPP